MKARRGKQIARRSLNEKNKVKKKDEGYGCRKWSEIISRKRK